MTQTKQVLSPFVFPLEGEYKRRSLLAWQSSGKITRQQAVGAFSSLSAMQRAFLYTTSYTGIAGKQVVATAQQKESAA